MAAPRKAPSHNKAPFEMTIREVYGLSRTKGEIGIEIEAEFSKPGDWMLMDSKYWRNEEDGSLRNHGREFVLNVPITLDELPRALQEWEKNTEKFPFRFSNRCSTHMHVNAQELNISQFVRVCTAWWMVETALVHTQGTLREGNLFALRGKDAAEIILSFAEELADGFHYFEFGVSRPRSENELRYAALNHAALAKFGSLEFRFMKGMSDPKDLDFWARTLYTFVHTAKEMELGEIVRLTGGTDLDRLELFRTLFGQQTARILIDLIGANWSKMVQENYQYGVLLDTSYETALKKLIANRPVGGRQYRFNLSEDEDRHLDPDGGNEGIPLREVLLENLWAPAEIVAEDVVMEDLIRRVQGERRELIPQRIVLAGAPDPNRPRRLPRRLRGLR